MKISQEEANALTKAYQNDKVKLDTTSLFLTKEELDRILTSDCTGIRIYLGQEKYTDASGDYLGVQLVAARVTTADPSGMDYLEKSSTQPCPKNCVV